MNRSVWVYGAFLVSLVLVTWLLASAPAHCAWCPGYTCYNSSACGGYCTCLVGPGRIGGSCYSTDLAPEGWEVLP